MRVRTNTLLLLALSGCSWDWDRFEPVPSNEGVCGAADQTVANAVPADTVAAPFGARVVDGRLEDWDQLTVEAGELLEGEAPSDAQDLTALFDLAWDEERLYLLVRIDDESISVQEGSFDDDHDGVEVLVNSRGDAPCTGDAGSPVLCEDDHHVMLSAAGVLALSHTSAAPAPGDIELGHAEEAASYTLELGLRWPFLLQQVDARGAPQQTLGLDIAVIDRDGDASRSVTMWRRAQDYRTDTRGYGSAVLVCLRDD